MSRVDPKEVASDLAALDKLVVKEKLAVGPGMIIGEIDLGKVQELDLLNENGQLKLLHSYDYDAMDRDSVRVWCNLNARYGLPTAELVSWLKGYIGDRTAIEIGAGHADLSFHLGIKATDNKMQELDEIKIQYALTRQPTIQYPARVEKIDAISAVKKYKPDVVIGQWVTHYTPPGGGGNYMGIVEEEILKSGAVYIMIGNRKIHGHKPILKLPHREVQLPSIRSRSTYPEHDTMWIWGEK